MINNTDKTVGTSKSDFGNVVLRKIKYKVLRNFEAFFPKTYCIYFCNALNYDF